MVEVSNVSFDFESLYKRYPRKEGKRRGMNKLRVTVKTTKDYRAFEKALDEYIALCAKEEREPRYIKHWGTFCNCWSDYLTKGIAIEKNSKKIVIESQIKRIFDGDL